MPAGFTKEFAASLDKICPLSVKEAEDRDEIHPGQIYIAPGNFHIVVEKSTLCNVIRLSSADLRNGHRPSADWLFESVAKIYQNRALGVIMTGMGRDGAVQLAEMNRHITIDNATRLEEICLGYAATLYKKTPLGKKWEGTDVKTLPNGSGYLYIRQAVRKVIDMFRELCDEFILVGHVKDIQIEQNGEELSQMALDLVGKLGTIICGESDAVGLVYRKGNETHVSFVGGDGTTKEARAPHLRGKDIIIATGNDDGTITTYWDKVYKND